MARQDELEGRLEARLGRWLPDSARRKGPIYVHVQDSKNNNNGDDSNNNDVYMFIYVYICTYIHVHMHTNIRIICVYLYVMCMLLFIKRGMIKQPAHGFCYGGGSCSASSKTENLAQHPLEAIAFAC